MQTAERRAAQESGMLLTLVSQAINVIGTIHHSTQLQNSLL